MQFLAIDIETTGLDDQKHGITEFAAVFTNLAGTEPPKKFYRYINPEDYVWSQYCLRLHADWLRRVLAAREAGVWECDGVKIVRNADALVTDFTTWLFTECSWPVPDKKWKSIVPAGKNFYSFDHRFLEAAGFPRMFKRRALDPAIGYIIESDAEPPDMATCKIRAESLGCIFKHSHVTHNALEDAEDVVALLQHWIKTT
jgi:hypothetical protein